MMLQDYSGTIAFSSAARIKLKQFQVARSFDTFTFLDPKTNYVSPLTPEDFLPFYETLDDTWFYQQEAAREGASMVNVELLRGLEDLEAKMIRMVPKTFDELRKALGNRASKFDIRSNDFNQKIAGKPIEDHFHRWLQHDKSEKRHKKPQ
ncbi:hypothetical protein ACHAPO_003437 [Fusarium lateritium]